ncbi:Thioredoxin-like [Aquimarina amphilecti]|uniref:Thioredoxin-like n=1 Tax=Aquimarina amphilecti TaxID=1038014 RepID=A0A1H7GBN1_AQUAM|nr:thioredoxin family protein [Aquimarina amphilecti]SEK35531.1 Thioredoxin-like [Aquimarina amphilecti]
MNKLAPFILVLIFFVSGNIYAQDWKYDFDEAVTLAKEKDQNIVLLFTGSDWCPPCIKLERKIFSNPEFKKFADKKFIWLKADFPKRKKNRLSKEQSEKNFELAERYNKKMVFPVILVIDKEGTVLGATGYRKMSAERYMSLLTTFDSFGN